ncbi:rhamnolipids biosynthesis 3-oxoacyl-reductase [Auriculariales sp. MPI-PUGE-AT-0066]|nr:rhamnolipids biosynthesis 3-oxoacyl-reductase [Auriculariales sp. MPI-PUGE-AT-0066]
MSIPDLRADTLAGVKGKVALVTGGGSGLGTMMAAALVQNGAKVYIASRKEKQLKEVSAALNKAGPGSCEYLIADLSTKAGCDALGAEIKKREKKLHILVNNSGATWGAPYEDFPEVNGWDKIMALNVKSLFYLTVSLTDLLAKDASNLDPGRVINIASVTSFSPHSDGDTGMALTPPGMGTWSYNASKAAAAHLTKQLAVTLAKKYITVNAICPGTFPSKMTAFSYSALGNLDKVHPMGRAGTTEDMAGAVLYLSGRGGAHVTGNAIIVDGGHMLYGAPMSLGPETKSKL